MDPYLEKFFGSFINQNPNEEDLIENLETFKHTPVFKLGMFKKLMINGLTFKKKLVTFFSKSDKDLDCDDIDLAGEFMIYHRGWFWISQVDISDENWVEGLKFSSDIDLLVSLKLSINYYEEHEEYEKCSFLVKIQNIVQENLEE